MSQPTPLAQIKVKEFEQIQETLLKQEASKIEQASGIHVSDFQPTGSLHAIQKRDGRIVPFDGKKIVEAIYRAGQETEEFDREEAARLAFKVVEMLEAQFDGHSIPSVEQIQDVVELTLMRSKWMKTARAYIVYREEHARLRKQAQEESRATPANLRHIESVQKRNGATVPFDPSKIGIVITKACRAVNAQVSAANLESLAGAVVRELTVSFQDRIPGVEQIQDTVERVLSEQGLFDVAKAYILYRKERERAREERMQLREWVAQRGIHTVITRSGVNEAFSMEKLEEFVGFLAKQYQEPIDVNAILRDCVNTLYDGIASKDIITGLIMAMRARIERDPVYASVTARVLLNGVYKDVLGVNEQDQTFLDRYRSLLLEQIRKGVSARRLDPRLLEFDFSKLSAALEPARDHVLKYMGAQTLFDRYFLRDSAQRLIETPQYFWMRVAMGVALNEPHKEERAIEFYHIMSSLQYVPSTPTLLHAGLTHAQMSSCYLTTVEDDLYHIFKCIGDNAQLSKWSGGIGNDWTNIRATNAMVNSINVGSQGLIPFLKIVDATTGAINRSGKRRGAVVAYLETWHYDIEDFIELRKNTGDERRRTHDTNTANWIPDLFMKRVISDQEWTLFSPEEVSDLHHIYGKEFERRYEHYEQLASQGRIRMFKKIRAKELWRKMISMLFETGHPWMTFKDPSNIRSPQDHVGMIHSSNLCTEITLNTSADETAVCNLGSVNLVSHIVGESMNYEQLARTVKTAVRMLDNIIDLNFYPTKEARASNLRHRPVGLGVMGYQDVLYLRGMRFDSNEAVAFSDEFMEFISYHAILASSELAKERGVYSTYRQSKWDRGLFPVDTISLYEQERGLPTGVEKSGKLDWTPVRTHVAQFGMRNSNCMAIAPTATIANINGCLPSIEPIYKNLYTKANFSGEFTVINHYLVQDLKALKLWNDSALSDLKRSEGNVTRLTHLPENIRERYKEVFEIDPHWIVRHAAARGKWIDQSQSVNIFMSTNSGKAISDVYMAAWTMGLKTTYYLRTLAASSIEKSTIDLNAQAATFEEFAPSAATPLPLSEGVLVCSVADGEACESCQ